MYLRKLVMNVLLQRLTSVRVPHACMTVHLLDLTSCVAVHLGMRWLDKGMCDVLAHLFRTLYVVIHLALFAICIVSPKNTLILVKLIYIP